MTLGCLGREVVMPADLCVPKPPTFSHAEAAGLLVGYCTAFNALVQRGSLRPGEVLLVTGAAGGMGAAAIQLGKVGMGWSVT